MKKIILASASPRRKELLGTTGLKFDICVSDYKEDLGLKKEPRALARFLSRKKAEEALQSAKDQAENALANLERAQQQLVVTEKMAALGQLTAAFERGFRGLVRAPGLFEFVRPKPRLTGRD